MKTKLFAGMAAALLAVSPAQAGHGHGYGRGCGPGDAAAWAIGGLIVGAAIASAAEPQVVYGAPPPAPVVVAPPAPIVVQAPAPAVVVGGPRYCPPPVVYVRPAVGYVCPPPVVHCRPLPPCPPPRFHRPHGPHFRVGFSVGW